MFITVGAKSAVLVRTQAGF